MVYSASRNRLWRTQIPWLSSDWKNRMGFSWLDNQRTNEIAFGNSPEIPLARDGGHLWLLRGYKENCLFTKKSWQRRFGHPGGWRIHELLKRVKSEEGNKETKGVLESIEQRCKECQFLDPKPYMVKVSDPNEDFIFNSEVVVDITLVGWYGLKVGTDEISEDKSTKTDRWVNRDMSHNRQSKNGITLTERAQHQMPW